MVAHAAPPRMRRLPLLILALSTLGLSHADHDTCTRVCGSRPLAISHGNLLRIVGGSSVLPGTWPWIVSFQFPTSKGYRHFCAGSLINSRWIVTNAHCLLIQTFLKVDYLRVQIGTTQRSKPGRDSQTRSIKRLVDHEHFKHDGYQNDISLIELDRPVECNDYIQPACLPDEDVQMEMLTHCYTAGWGITELKRRAEYADILQEAKVDLISKDLCNSSNYYFTGIREENICALPEEARIDRCKGDGGSPLMCRMPKSERFWVVGMNSWGKGCKLAKSPGVFTATQPYYNWIQGILKDPPESALVPPFKPTPPPTKPPPTKSWTPPAWATAKNLARPTVEMVNGGWYGFGGRNPSTYILPIRVTSPRPRTSRGWYKGPRRTFPPYTFPMYATSARPEMTSRYMGWNNGPSIIYRLPRRRSTPRPWTQWQYQRRTTASYWNRPRA